MLTEGKYDKNRFKAIFLVGAPAAGKTEFYKEILANKDMKHLDPDKVMVFLIKKYGGSLKDTSNYTKFQKSVKTKLEMINNIYKNGGLGLVIDGTGRNIDLIKKLKKDLESFKYDTLMVYIKTPIQKAMEKAKQRKRSVDNEFIKKVYTDLNKNIPEYKKIFNKFIEVNSEDEYKKAEKKINQWLKEK
jgi:predicted kinase